MTPDIQPASTRYSANKLPTLERLNWFITIRAVNPKRTSPRQRPRLAIKGGDWNRLSEPTSLLPQDGLLIDRQHGSWQQATMNSQVFNPSQQCADPLWMPAGIGSHARRVVQFSKINIDVIGRHNNKRVWNRRQTWRRPMCSEGGSRSQRRLINKWYPFISLVDS